MTKLHEQRKMYKYAVIAFVLFLSLVPVYAKGAKDASGKQETAAATDAAGDTAVQERGVKYNSSVNYPFFKTEPELNKQLATITASILKDFNVNFYNDISTFDEIPIGYECVIKAKDVYEDDKNISFLLSVYTFTGGVHGETTLIPINYSKNTKTLLSLKDVVGGTLSQAVLTKLSQESRKLLQEQQKKGVFNSNTEWIEQGTEPSEENFSVWLFKGDHIRIVFQQYQVAPYSEGMPEITIPLSFFKQ